MCFCVIELLCTLLTKLLRRYATQTLGILYFQSPSIILNAKNIHMYDFGCTQKSSINIDLP